MCPTTCTRPGRATAGSARVCHSPKTTGELLEGGRIGISDSEPSVLGQNAAHLFYLVIQHYSDPACWLRYRRSGGDALVSPAQHVMRLGFGFAISQALCVVADLDVADRLSDGERSVDDLAAETNCHADALYRVMRLL